MPSKSNTRPSIYKRIKRKLRILPLSLKFLKSYILFLKTKNTTKEGFVSMRKLFSLTNGRFNDGVTFISGLFHPKYKIKKSTGVLGEPHQEEINNVVLKLKKNGYYIFGKKLSQEIIDDLMNFALSTPAIPLVENTDGKTKVEPIIYDRKSLLATRYDFNMQDLFECKAVQKLVSDETLLAIAQKYLGTRPVQDMIGMWWSAPFKNNKASAGAAQLYHFDLDRIKFLKFFFYLTDVDSSRGPHCFVAKSHRHKPKELLRDGRITDEEILQYYNDDQLIEITGLAGCIVAEDTSGFHKGKKPDSGDRLIFQIEFATNLFGQNYPKIKVNEKFSKEFIDFAKKYQYTFSNFEFN